MKVTIVYPDLPFRLDYRWNGHYHHGVAMISASLKRAGHQTSLMHLTAPMPREEFLAQVRREAPDLIGYSSTTNMFPFALETVGWIREAGITTPIIFGGFHARLGSEEVIATDGIDYICIGEGEQSIVDLCERLEAGKPARDIPNIWAKEKGVIYRNAARPLLQNLDELPFSDRTIFNYPLLINEKEGMATVMASRGCPFDCTYCCNHALRAEYANQNYTRFRSVDHVLAEIAEIRRNYSFVKAVHFDDDILFLKREWFTEFTEKYKKQIGLPFYCNYRPGLHAESALPALADAGCKHIQIGLESGNEDIRNRVLGRNMSTESIATAIRSARQLGMEVEANSMVGIPEETIGTMLDTVKLNARLKPDRMWVSIFYPFSKTNLHKLCVDKGYLSERHTTSYFFDSILDLEGVSLDQIRMVRWYFRPLAHFYRLAFRLRPAPLARAVEKGLDFVLARQVVAKLAVAMVPRAMWLRRKLLPREGSLLSKYVDKPQDTEQSAPDGAQHGDARISP